MGLDAIRAMVTEAGWGSVATSVDGQPRVRPMAFVMLDDGRLWSSTYACSGKRVEFERNARVEVCFVDGKKNHVRVEGVVDLTGDAAAKERLLELNPKVRKHFTGGDDPNFVLVEIRPTVIRWKAPGFSEYEVLKF